LFKRFALLLSLIFAIAVSSTAGAQQGTPTLDPDDVEGLESGYARMYIADIEAMMATPEAMESMSLEDIALSGMGAVFTFEDEGAAEDAFGDFADGFAEGFLEGSGTEAEKSEIDDLGNQAVEYFGETEVDEETTSPTSLILVQDGEHIFIAMILGGTEVSEDTRAFAEYLIEANIPDTEVEFNDDGSSTGGVYDILPNEENTDIVQGMVPFMDANFMEDTAAE
jgi:hypothetical protein